VNKVLIFSPKEEDEVVSSFPLIHLIDEKLNPDEINIIQQGETARLYQALPYQIKIWDIPDDSYSFMGIHKFSKNLHDVFNITHFFDLRGEFLSQWTGKTFASAERIGERKSWWSKYLLNNEYQEIGRPGQDAYYVKLLGKFLKEDTTEFKLFNKDQFGNKFVDVTQVLFFIDNINKEDKYFDFWMDSFEHFEKMPMTMVLYKVGEEGHEFLEKSKELLHEMVPITMSLPEEAFDLIKASKIVVTTNRWVARLATYFSKECFLITENIRQYSYGHHFPKGVNLLEIRDGAIHMAILEDTEEILDEDVEWVDLFYKLKENVIDS
jgi:hypothetical protein